MAVTRSWELRVITPAEVAQRTRSLDALWLLAASALVAAGLALAFRAKTENFADTQAKLDRGELLDLNQDRRPAQLLPFLLVFKDPGELQMVAEQISDFLQRSGPIHNVGALARLRIGQGPALRPLPLAKLKPLFVVRTPREFRRQFAQWCGLYFVAFYAVFLLWRWRKWQGDVPILAVLHLLTGFGLILLVSMRDPLRDTLEFRKFAWGVAAGCLALLLPLFRRFRWERFSKWCYTPLFLAFALFGILLRFGAGPGGSTAKVNVGPVQPVEAIKILLVFFLAGYFARQWERLRDLRENRVRWVDVPRLSHLIPVLIAVGCALLLFFLLKDLGPALVCGFLFLAMFAVARGKPGLVLLGISLLAGGVATGYLLGKPPTVVDRISMWLSPWDNDVHGGDQLAHSLWAFSTGGPLGSGPGRGDPGMIPAGDTDLVLPAIGEEWGFAGVATVCALFVFLIWRALRIALRAPNEYGLFLALGLTSLIAFEMLLISGGVLGAIPLSGVVSPFLSSGNTAMLANFLIFGLLLAISNHPRESGISAPFRVPVRVLACTLGALAIALLGKAAYYQVACDGDYLARDTHVFAEDGVKRPQHNPRLNSLAREIRRGNIYDRNGVLLATSDWNELEKRRAQYDQLGVTIDQVCSRLDNRHYPFGSATAHLIGDLRTGENFHATNASLIEHDSNQKLQGFSSYAELAPLIRHRHQPRDPGMARLKARDRDVRATIDIRLQMNATAILKDALEKAHKDHGALVVMHPQTGDILAMVSEPELPLDSLDRARYGQYPPGSTFKLVTAMAALRKNPQLENRRFLCHRLSAGRAGTVIPGWRREIKDDIGDSAHGTLAMERAIAVSCNAWFAQLGVYEVGANALKDMAESLEIPAGEIPDLKQMLPFAAYGQGPVLVTPFKMARVAATIAAGGAMPQGRWVSDDSNSRNSAPREIVSPAIAAFLARAMRGVVTGGTARRAFGGLDVPVAGKTGTAQLDEGLPHSWFVGFTPAMAFAVVVEHGGYGAAMAAPIARKLVEAAQSPVDHGTIGSN